MKTITKNDYQQLLEIKQLLTAWLSEAAKLAPEIRTGSHRQGSAPHNCFLSKKYELLKTRFVKTKTVNGRTNFDYSDPVTALIIGDGYGRRSWETIFKEMRKILNAYLDEVKVVN